MFFNVILLLFVNHFKDFFVIYRLPDDWYYSWNHGLTHDLSLDFFQQLYIYIHIYIYTYKRIHIYPLYIRFRCFCCVAVYHHIISFYFINVNAMCYLILAAPLNWLWVKVSCNIYESHLIWLWIKFLYHYQVAELSWAVTRARGYHASYISTCVK